MWVETSLNVHKNSSYTIMILAMPCSQLLMVSHHTKFVVWTLDMLFGRHFVLTMKTHGGLNFVNAFTVNMFNPL